jgi:3-hydroxyacyl-CoA dehydrogenase
LAQEISGPIAGRIAVLGCGLIGESWAALFLHHGFDVQAWDPSEDARASFSARLDRPMAQLGELGKGAAQKGKLTLCATLQEAVTDAAFIQENAPESIPLKQALYAQIEAVPGAATIATSASGLTWSDLCGTMSDPNRLITAHPFNPPHLVPLVEVYGPDKARLDHAEALYRAIGRVPVRLKKEATGHIANRLASALYREAVHIVAEGIADVEAVDAALVNGPGLRWSVMGAHMTYHLGGGAGGIEHYLRHLGPSQQRRWATLGTPDLSPEVCDTLIEGVKSASHGRTIPELEAERDAGLMAALRTRAKDI